MAIHFMNEVVGMQPNRQTEKSDKRKAPKALLGEIFNQPQDHTQDCGIGENCRGDTALRKAAIGPGRPGLRIHA